MIPEEQIDLLVERLVQRIEKANVYFLENIGSSIKKIRDIKPSQAHQLAQILKYGGDYDDIVRQIKKYTGLNINEIDEIFSSYAKKDQMFYEKFYKYRNIPFVPYAQNEVIRTQTLALANVVKNQMYNYFKTNVLGYTIRGLDGKIKFMGLRETYNYLLDEALLNVNQGKETFDNAIQRILKDIGGSGLKTLDYKSGRSVRLDSIIRTHLKDGLQELHIENQKIYGKEFDSDGVEITVHSNPAPDHADIQGRQFSNKEFDKLQNGDVARDYKGKMYSLDHDSNGTYRPIGELNCYHNIFPIILGVSEPEYSDKELKQILDDNNKGFEFEGEHYTNYQGTQMQRNLERKIREQKDIQILAKASDNKELIGKSQKNIRILTNKYRELSKISGLPTKAKRLRVANYRRTKV